MGKTILDGLGERQNIDQHVSYSPVDVENHLNHLRVTQGEANEIVFSIMCDFGFPISVNELMPWDAFSAHNLANDVFEDLCARATAVCSRSHMDATNRANSFTSRL